MNEILLIVLLASLLTGIFKVRRDYQLAKIALSEAPYYAVTGDRTKTFLTVLLWPLLDFFGITMSYWMCHSSGRSNCFEESKREVCIFIKDAFNFAILIFLGWAALLSI